MRMKFGVTQSHDELLKAYWGDFDQKKKTVIYSRAVESVAFACDLIDP